MLSFLLFLQFCSLFHSGFLFVFCITLSFLFFWSHCWFVFNARAGNCLIYLFLLFKHSFFLTLLEFDRFLVICRLLALFGLFLCFLLLFLRCSCLHGCFLFIFSITLCLLLFLCHSRLDNAESLLFLLASSFFTSWLERNFFLVLFRFFIHN